MSGTALRIGLSVVATGFAVALCGVAWGQGEDCVHYGPDNVGCGSGENACVGGTEALCRADTARVLGTGLFACGFSWGEWDCGTSATEKDLCYTQYNGCTWVATRTPKCAPDNDAADPHYDWIKAARDC